MQENEIVLSYKSNSLRRSDVKSFEDFNQLNDIAIGFYYEVLFDDKVREMSFDHGKHDQVHRYMFLTYVATHLFVYCQQNKQFHWFAVILILSLIFVLLRFEDLTIQLKVRV